jgi:hypothetical protein
MDPERMSSYTGDHIALRVRPDPMHVMRTNELDTNAAIVAGISQMANTSIRNNSKSNPSAAGSNVSGVGLDGCQTGDIQPIIRKRRGGSRRACNECKQQKVSCNSPEIDVPWIHDRTTQNVDMCIWNACWSPRVGSLIASLWHRANSLSGLFSLQAITGRLQGWAQLQADIETKVVYS